MTWEQMEADTNLRPVGVHEITLEELDAYVQKLKKDREKFGPMSSWVEEVVIGDGNEVIEKLGVEPGAGWRIFVVSIL